MHADRRLVLFRRLARAGALLAACVVVLGAWVRLTDAGLGCPDWPACYGHLVPSAEHGTAKAWHEMIHRYVAGTLGLVIVGLFGWAFWRRHDRDQPVIPVALLFLVVCLQGTLGALTVTWLLKPLIVTSHLLGGLTTLGLLWWLSIEPQRRALTPAEASLRPFALVGFAALVMQVALGGWTSTNYAAVACPDFPTCQGAWWPATDYRDAFVLWRGLGLNYEGGVLANPARVAIHLTHRLGAVVAGTTLLTLGLTALLRGRARAVRGAGGLLAGAVVLQITLGIATVHFGVPLPVATAHNAGAALLVIGMVTLLRALWPASAIGMVPLNRVQPAR